MEENDFWIRMMFRICREFQGMPSRRLQYIWCDGLYPKQYLLNDPEPQIKGEAMIFTGPAWSAPEQWEFALFLPQRVNSRSAINWALLLPSDHLTCWMAFDFERRYLELEPGAAVPDLSS